MVYAVALFTITCAERLHLLPSDGFVIGPVSPPIPSGDGAGP